jgi:hypothetical protein
MTIKEAAKEALAVQNASNLSGVVRTFRDCLDTLWDEAHATGKGTAFVNQHPIAVLFADKIADLSGAKAYGLGTVYSRSYDECRRLAGED